MRRLSLLAGVLAALLATTAQAQDLTLLSGRWTVVDDGAARQGGGFPNRLVITAAPLAVTIQADGYGPETYSLDGRESRRYGDRTATARIDNGTLAVTFRRQRSSRDGVASATLTEETYRVSGAALIVQRRSRAERPGEPSPAWSPALTVTYRR